MLKLPQITIACIDCINYNSASRALLKSIGEIEFGGVEFFSDIELNGISTTIINKIDSKFQYSEFIFKKLNEYIQTEYVLIIQYDGYIINPNLWNDEFLNYDYIGAPWWYKDYNVGNGGFSLRSKRLLEEISKPEYIHNYPEDDTICRFYGRILKDKDFKFASDDIAKIFSFEPNLLGSEFRNNTFGFHGIPKFILR